MLFTGLGSGQNGSILRTLSCLQSIQYVGDYMLKKYNIGDQVLISKKLSAKGRWENISPQSAEILDIKETVTFGPAYTLEINGHRCNICYWESDIDGLSHGETSHDSLSNP